MNKPQVLTIAGSDSGGGAGIQADLKTICMHNTYGLSVITALTAQNTQGVQNVLPIEPEFIESQLNSVFTDFNINAVKIGMVHNSSVVKVIARAIKKYRPEHVVLDPVMVTTSGDSLISDNTVTSLKTELFPLATVITPNIKEAEKLGEISITNFDNMLLAAKKLLDKEQALSALLIKGGGLEDFPSHDLLLERKADEAIEKWFKSPRIETQNNHGTGCTLSSAIACNLAKGYSLSESIKNSKEYIDNALKEAVKTSPGKDPGPVDHNFIFNK